MALRRCAPNALRQLLASSPKAAPCRGISDRTGSPPDDALKLVKETIAQNKVVVFSKTCCNFSKKAEEAFQRYQMKAEVKVIEVDKSPNSEDLMNALQEVTGTRGVPRVFVAGKFIGGGEDTVRCAESGKLKTLLVDAGAVVDQPAAAPSSSTYPEGSYPASS